MAAKPSGTFKVLRVTMGSRAVEPCGRDGSGVFASRRAAQENAKKLRDTKGNMRYHRAMATQWEIHAHEDEEARK